MVLVFISNSFQWCSDEYFRMIKDFYVAVVDGVYLGVKYL